MICINVGLKPASLYVSACWPLSHPAETNQTSAPPARFHHRCFKPNEAPTTRNVACSATGRSSGCPQHSERSLLFESTLLLIRNPIYLLSAYLSSHLDRRPPPNVLPELNLPLSQQQDDPNIRTLWQTSTGGRSSRSSTRISS